MDFQKIFRTSEGNLHHAYLIIGRGTREPLVAFLEESAGVVVRGNPDFWHGAFDVFTIEDARRLAVSQEAKAFGKVRPSQTHDSGADGVGRKIFIVEANSVSESAQNSLLKVFEEPTAGTHFFFLLPQDTVLPTLRSRMHVIHVSKVPFDTGNPVEARLPQEENILDMKIGERMKLVKETVEAISDEDKTKQDAVSLVNRIEAELYVKGVEKNAALLSVCEQARLSLYDNGAPVKMILEHVMLAI
jgi:DNA polymerase III delta prime subunit